MFARLLPTRFLLVVVMLAAGGAAMVPTSAAAADMDCGDFATQAAAQAFSNAAGAGDPHRLDADGDGVACESLPCPCSSQVQPVVGTTPSQAPPPTSAPTTDPNGSGNSGPTRRTGATVVRVSDGDTIRVRLRNGAEHSVRFIGIDTPEVYGGRQCGGPQASRAMRRLAPVGSRVRLVSDPSQADKDRYDRLLRYVMRGGRDLGKAQISAGRARVYVYRNDPFRRTADYRRAEQRSKAGERGSWKRCWR